MPKSTKLSHFDASGRAAMVDVGGKQPTRRTATASAFVALSAAVISVLPTNPKGNPLEVARIAGIQAAKRTAELIPMCHPLALTHIDVQTELVADGVRSSARRHAGLCAAPAARSGLSLDSRLLGLWGRRLLLGSRRLGAAARARPSVDPWLLGFAGGATAGTPATGARTSASTAA
jgi:hypothetical protein